MTNQNGIGAASTTKAAKRAKWTAEQRQGSRGGEYSRRRVH
jgi:hypothetical protein